MVSLPPPLTAEILVDDAWQAVSARTATAVTVGRGASSEGSKTQPGRCGLAIDNRDRSKSPRNPTSPLFGKIGRNTPFRLSLNAGTVGLVVPGAGRATTPDDADLDILGDIDIRIDVRLVNWGQGAFLELAAKQEFTTEQRSWRLLQLGATGQAELVWFTDGTAASGTAVQSTVALPVRPGERIALRVTLDVDNGAGGWTVTWYTADTIDGPWTQLGDQVTGAGVTSIFNSNAPLDVGNVVGMLLDAPQGRFYALQVYNGIGGTLVADADFTAQATGTTAFTDSAGRDWTVDGGAEISSRHVRFAGEIPAWPPSRDLSGADISTTLAPAGILRRLSQGTKSLQSTLRRRIPSFSPVAYWPAEEGRNATSVSSPIEGVAAFTPTGFDFAADDSLPGSSPLASIAASASFTAIVPPAAAGEWQVELVYFLEEMPAAESTLFEVRSNGTARRIRVNVATNLVRIQGYDVDDTELFNGFTTAPQFTGAWNRLQIRAVNDGSNVDYSVRWIVIGGTGFSQAETIAGSAGYVTQVRNTFAAGLEGLSFGHLTVFDTQTDTPFSSADHGFDGQTAGARMVRLCQEEGIPFVLAGVADDTQEMGPQRVDTILQLLQDAADADRGFFVEQREGLGLAYRPRTTLYNQNPRFTLEFTEGVIADFKATDDDKLTENDVTVKRTEGSEARAFLATGRLSIQEPPDGVGTGYDVQHTLNLETDAQTGPMAGWLLHLGTFDGMRYPQITLDLANPRIQEIIDEVMSADVGDLIRLTDLPDEYGPDDVDLIIQGYSEEIGEDAWRITFHCVPGQPYRVAVVDDRERGRVDANPDGSTLALATTDNDPAILVHTPARTAMGPAVWITGAGPAPTYPAEIPYDIKFGGETVRVTECVPVGWDTFNRSEAHGTVLNINTDFEEDLDGWSGSGAALERVATPEPASAPFGGQWSMQVTPNGVAEFPNAGSDMIAVVAGTQYNLSGWLLCATSRTVALNINWFDAGGTYMSTSSNDDPVTANTWTAFSLTATAPVGAAFANLAPTVPDFPPSTDVLWADELEFSAVVANTWGRSASGFTWAEAGGPASDRSVNGTAGVVTLAATPANIRFQRLIGGLTDTEVLVRVSVSQVATGNALLPSVLLRYVDTNNFYRARVHLGLSGAMSASITRGTTAVGSTVTLPYTYSAGQWFWMRARLTGHRVQLRVWPDGQLEPAVWHKDETIASDTIASGQVGVSASAFDTNTNVSPQLRFDDFTILTPQLMTVQRSLNGVVKAHAVGAEVRVANPAVVAL